MLFAHRDDFYILIIVTFLVYLIWKPNIVMIIEKEKHDRPLWIKMVFSSATCDGCLDLCSLSLCLMSSSPHKKQVSYIKTALDTTQSNNTAVSSETCSRWPSNIQKLNSTDAWMYNSSDNTSEQAGPHDPTWPFVLKVLLQGIGTDQNDMKRRPTVEYAKKCTECPMDFRPGWY